MMFSSQFKNRKKTLLADRVWWKRSRERLRSRYGTRNFIFSFLPFLPPSYSFFHIFFRGISINEEKMWDPKRKWTFIFHIIRLIFILFCNLSNNVEINRLVQHYIFHSTWYSIHILLYTVFKKYWNIGKLEILEVISNNILPKLSLTSY